MKQTQTGSGRRGSTAQVHHKDTMSQDDELRARVDIKTPWFKLAVDNIDWKEVLVVAMVLVTVVYLVKS